MLSLFDENKDLGPRMYLLYDQYHVDTSKGIAKTFRNNNGITLEYGDTAMTLLPVLMSVMYTRSWFYVVCSVDHILHIFKMIRVQRLENKHIQWFIVLEDKLEKDLLMSGLEILLREGTRVSIITRHATTTLAISSSKVDVDNKMRFHETGKYYVNRNYSTEDISILLLADLDWMYSDMGERELIVTANDNWPFFGKGRIDPDGTVRPHAGIDVSIVEALGHALNFTYKVQSPADGKWGGPQPDGTVTGMIGMVARHEANLAICEITISVKVIMAPYLISELNQSKKSDPSPMLNK
ncbi:hypothetical protein SK128_020811 [Halocaridina rubra]|uniref:Ionotropic glutamate receptor L-glutamate and glycine-binding domain-containing protein n=1 Tax=Halocaridina rubra TaxID=373956 RepID=A0AAN8WUG8_HALRR